MRIQLRPQTPIEFLGKTFGMVPVPLAHTHIFPYISRALNEAVSAGIFEALDHGPCTPEEIASSCKLNAFALTGLLATLTSLGYLREKQGRFRLSPLSRKWLLAGSPYSLCDQILFMREVWNWMDALPDFLRTGQGLDYHRNFNARQWELYQKGMQSIARNSAGEVARKTPLPPKAVLMLDIGGSHGEYSAALCRRHPSLKAVILDLPEAVRQSRPLLEAHYSGNQISYTEGDALVYDYGANKYDLVFLSSLMHHFTSQQNKSLSEKISVSLKSGGYFVIQEFIRPPISAGADIIGSTLSLFFSLTSNGGTWSGAEISGWQRAAGLTPLRTHHLLTMPGFAQFIARKD